MQIQIPPWSTTHLLADYNSLCMRALGTVSPLFRALGGSVFADTAHPWSLQALHIFKKANKQLQRAWLVWRCSMHPNNLGNGEKEKSPVRCPAQNFSSHNKEKTKLSNKLLSLLWMQLCECEAVWLYTLVSSQFKSVLQHVQHIK